MIAVAIVILIIGAVIAAIYAQRDNMSQSPITPNQPTSQSQTADTPGITQSEAESIVIDKYGGTVKETESDSYEGTPAWEVEVRDSTKGRIEVKVDKQSGDILNVEQD